jgi:hypothetical protein
MTPADYFRAYLEDCAAQEVEEQVNPYRYFLAQMESERADALRRFDAACETFAAIVTSGLGAEAVMALMETEVLDPLLEWVEDELKYG